MQRCVSITLSANTKNYNLYDVLTGADKTSVVVGYLYDDSDADHRLLPPVCQELAIQSDAGNGAKLLFVGDKNLSAINKGMTLAAGSNYTKRSVSDAISLKDHYLRTDTAGAVVNVMIEVL